MSTRETTLTSCTTESILELKQFHIQPITLGSGNYVLEQSDTIKLENTQLDVLKEENRRLQKLLKISEEQKRALKNELDYKRKDAELRDGSLFSEEERYNRLREEVNKTREVLEQYRLRGVTQATISKNTKFSKENVTVHNSSQLKMSCDSSESAVENKIMTVTARKGLVDEENLNIRRNTDMVKHKEKDFEEKCIYIENGAENEPCEELHVEIRAPISKISSSSQYDDDDDDNDDEEEVEEEEVCNSDEFEYEEQEVNYAEELEDEYEEGEICDAEDLDNENTEESVESSDNLSNIEDTSSDNNIRDIKHCSIEEIRNINVHSPGVESRYEKNGNITDRECMMYVSKVDSSDIISVDLDPSQLPTEDTSDNVVGAQDVFETLEAQVLNESEYMQDEIEVTQGSDLQTYLEVSEGLPAELVLQDGAPTQRVIILRRVPINVTQVEMANAETETANFHKKQNNAQMMTDVKKSKDIRAFVCPQCGKSFIRKSHLKEHIRHHTGERPYQCSECKKYFGNQSYLNVHMRLHTGERPFQCPQCNKCFTRKYHLKVHVRQHTGERPYQCLDCDKAFTHIGHLSVHQRQHTGERPYKCPVCCKSFTQRNTLKVHYRQHSGERPYECNICNKAFTQLGLLKSHLTKHSGERPFQCADCDKCFTQKTNLKLHQKQHNSERVLFKCTQCSKSFPRIGYLKLHLKQHMGKRPFPCPQCNKSFSHRNFLATHIKQHSCERPHKCSVCGKSFFQQGTLKIHMRQSHGIIKEEKKS